MPQLVLLNLRDLNFTPDIIQIRKPVNRRKHYLTTVSDDREEMIGSKEVSMTEI